MAELHESNPKREARAVDLFTAYMAVSIHLSQRASTMYKYHFAASSISISV